MQNDDQITPTGGEPIPPPSPWSNAEPTAPTPELAPAPMPEPVQEPASEPVPEISPEIPVIERIAEPTPPTPPPPAAPVPPALPEKKKTNVWVIVLIVVVVLCCLCLILGALLVYLYQYGDQIFGLTQIIRPALPFVG